MSEKIMNNNGGRVFAYVRCSAKDQNEARQVIAMQEAGIPKRSIYVEKKSGKDFNRPVYRKLLKRVKENDIIVIKSIDRLGRNYTEIQEQWKIITTVKNVDIIVLDMPLLNTTTNEQDLTGRFISNLVLQILSYVAEVERENIRQRQKEGIAAAKMRGVKFGRESMPIPDNFEEVRLMYRNHEISSRKAGKMLGVGHTTFLRWTRMAEEGNDEEEGMES